MIPRGTTWVPTGYHRQTLEKLTWAFLKAKCLHHQNASLLLTFDFVVYVRHIYTVAKCGWLYHPLWFTTELMLGFSLESYLIYTPSSPSSNQVGTSVVRVNGLGLTQRVMKFIYTPCKFNCIIFIYIHVSVNVGYEMCKCKFLIV